LISASSLPLRTSASPLATSEKSLVLIFTSSVAATVLSGVSSACAPPTKPTLSVVVWWLKTIDCTTMYPASNAMNRTVPTTKNRLRTLVRNSRRTTSRNVRSAESPASRSGSSRRSNAILRHRFAEYVEQARHVAAELVHRPCRQRGLQHVLVGRAAVQLQQPP